MKEYLSRMAEIRASQVVQWVKNPPAMQEMQVSSLGRSPGEGHGNPLQYLFLENAMAWGTWGLLQSTGSQRVSQTRLSNFTFTFKIVQNFCPGESKLAGCSPYTRVSIFQSFINSLKIFIICLKNKWNSMYITTYYIVNSWNYWWKCYFPVTSFLFFNMY